MKFGISDLLLAVVSAIFVLGIRFWFPVCQPMMEGYMSCHWAGEALKALSVLFLVLSVMHLFVPDGKIKTGIALSLMGICMFSACIPDRIIAICPGVEMHCRAHTLPWTLAFSVVLFLLSLADGAFYLSQAAKEKHRRGKFEGNSSEPSEGQP